jgi:hypothetical protein
MARYSVGGRSPSSGRWGIFVAASFLATILAGSPPATADDPKAPDVPDGCLFRPSFETSKGTIDAGTAFFVTLPDQPRPVMLTALHLLGPAGGLPKDVPPADVPATVKGLAVSDCFKDTLQFKFKAEAIVIPDAARYGTPSKAGDVLAFWGPEDKRIHRLELAAEAPKEDERVWLLASAQSGGPAGQRVHPARMVEATTDGECTYRFDDPKISLRATSGAPVVNAAGRVVAINVAGGSQGGKVIGFGTPVARFKPHLEEAVKKAPKP